MPTTSERTAFDAARRNSSSQTVGQTLDKALTYAASQATVGAASAAALAASTNNTQKVTLFVPASADTGIYINFGGTAAAAGTSFLIPSGSSLEISTLQAINAIRAGASNVTLYILSGVA